MENSTTSEPDDDAIIGSAQKLFQNRTRSLVVASIACTAWFALAGFVPLLLRTGGKNWPGELVLHTVCSVVFGLLMAPLARLRARIPLERQGTRWGALVVIGSAGMVVTLALVLALRHLPDSGWQPLAKPPAPLVRLLSGTEIGAASKGVYAATNDDRLVGYMPTRDGEGGTWEAMEGAPPPPGSVFHESATCPLYVHMEPLLWLLPPAPGHPIERLRILDCGAEYWYEKDLLLLSDGMVWRLEKWETWIDGLAGLLQILIGAVVAVALAKWVARDRRAEPQAREEAVRGT